MNVSGHGDVMKEEDAVSTGPECGGPVLPAVILSGEEQSEDKTKL